MAYYRLYLRKEGRIVGRDDFTAESDAAGVWIAERLFEACGDECDGYELWEGARLLASQPAQVPAAVADIAAKTQSIVQEREEIIRNSRWAIARSKRLLERIERSGLLPR